VCDPWQARDFELKTADENCDVEMDPEQRRARGAYYTAPDVTSFICRAVLIPHLFDLYPSRSGFAGPLCAPQGAADTLRYIPEALRREGLLPAETAAERLARRARVRETLELWEAGQIRTADDCVTHNLDLALIARDRILSFDAPALGEFYYGCLRRLTVLDPSCGDGAFLLAALRVLHPLHQACLRRMRELLEAPDAVPGTAAVEFREELARIGGDPRGPDTAIARGIVAENLYGVDLMPEAVHACRARLRGAVEHEAAEPLETLRDNIRCGNALVGSIPPQRPTPNRLPPGRLPSVRGRGAQPFTPRTAGPHAHTPTPPDSQTPFDWPEHFPEPLGRSGFGAVVGNPPYVEYARVRREYEVAGYGSPGYENLYAFFLERGLQLLAPGGRLGMIVPVSAMSVEAYRPLMDRFRPHALWISSFSNRPAKLFPNVEQRLAILLCSTVAGPALKVSPYQHWYAQERPHLLARLRYSNGIWWRGMPAKTGCAMANSAFTKIIAHRGTLGICEGRLSLVDLDEAGGPRCPPNSQSVTRESRSGGRPTPNARRLTPNAEGSMLQHAVFLHDGPTYWVRALPFPPDPAAPDGCGSHYHRIAVASQEDARVLAAILSSSTFYFFFKATSNCRDLGQATWSGFPIDPLPQHRRERLAELGAELERVLRRTARTRSRTYPSGRVEYREYYPARAKDVLDRVDVVLAEHYGFTAEELAYAVNLDLKYRSCGADPLRTEPVSFRARRSGRSNRLR
jgi:hypothetical protein